MKYKIGIGILGIIVLGFFYIGDLLHYNWFISCPFKSITGYDCPGCGSQRAIYQLLYFHFKKAFFLNPLLLIIGGYLMFVLIIKTPIFNKKFYKLQTSMLGSKMIIFLILLVLVFFIIRNTNWYLEEIKLLTT